LVSDLNSFCAAAAGWDGVQAGAFQARTDALRQSYAGFVSPDAVPGDPLAGHFAHLAEVLPHTAIMAPIRNANTRAVFRARG